MRFLWCLFFSVFIGTYSAAVVHASLLDPADDFCPILLKKLPKKFRLVIQQKLFDSISSVEGKFQQLKMIESLGQEHDKKFYKSIIDFVQSVNNIDGNQQYISMIINYYDLYTISGRLRFKNTYGVAFQEVSNIANLEVALNSFLIGQNYLKRVSRVCTYNRYLFVASIELLKPENIFDDNWQKFIKAISLRMCQLSNLPKHVVDWENLLMLDLNHNQLTSLPSSVGAWKNLQFINLSHNRLTRLPESVCYWQSLREIDLSHNQLQVLPDSIGAWQKLIKFKASYNKLTTLPRSVDSWECLSKMDISRNHLTSLPRSVWTSHFLTKLVIDLIAIDSWTSKTFWKNPAITIETSDVLYEFFDEQKNCIKMTVVLDEEEWQRPYKIEMLKSQILPLLSFACQFPELSYFVFGMTISILRDSAANSRDFRFLSDYCFSRVTRTGILIGL